MTKTLFKYIYIPDNKIVFCTVKENDEIEKVITENEYSELFIKFHNKYGDGKFHTETYKGFLDIDSYTFTDGEE